MSTPAIPRAAYLASAALPAAGAYTVPTGLAVPLGIRFCVFEVEYTRGAVGGAPSFVLYGGDGTQLYELPLPDLTFGVVAGKASSSAALYRFALPRVDVGGLLTIGLACAETGVTGTPGTIAVFANRCP